MKDLIIKILNGFEIDLDKIINLFKLDLDFKDSCSKYLIRGFINICMKDIIKILSEEIEYELENSVNNFEPKFSLFGKDVNCSISKTKNGLYKINLNRGLIQFLFDYIRLFCFSFSINFEEPIFFEQIKLNSNNFKLIIRKIMTKYWSRKYEKSEVHPKESLINENSNFLILNLFYEIRFIITHELTHKLSQRFDNKSLKNAFSPICINYIEKYENSKKFKEGVLKNWYEELECDNYAIQVLLNAKNIHNEREKIISFSLFNYFFPHYLCEIFYINRYPHIDDLRTWETHPPFKLRLNCFLKKIEDYVDKKFIQNLLNIMSSIEKYIKTL